VENPAWLFQDALEHSNSMLFLITKAIHLMMLEKLSRENQDRD